MPCKFADLKGTSGYRKGCRCSRCREAKREIAQRPPTAFEDRNAGTRARYPVPVGPILELLERWLEQVSAETDVPYEALARELGVKSGDSAARMMSRYRNQESTHMAFSMADKIVSVLYGPQCWFENEALNAIYEEHA